MDEAGHLVTTWAFISGILIGWIIGVSMSYRKIRRSGTISNTELLELVRQHKELREEIEKRDSNIVDFPGNDNGTEH